MWVPLLASVGVGAATYYTMTKNNQSLGQTMQQVVPLVSQMSNTNGGSGGNSSNSSNSNNSAISGSNNGGGSNDQQTLGPYGMS
ncbi:hypothetical protein [Virgibacillus phasianinus]|nr:hypothetical protein [Virgibacillus phasianinus]